MIYYYSIYVKLQLSTILGFVPIAAAWIYAEYLEHKKFGTPTSIWLKPGLRLSKKMVLLEGGALRSASPKSSCPLAFFSEIERRMKNRLQNWGKDEVFLKKKKTVGLMKKFVKLDTQKGEVCKAVYVIKSESKSTNDTSRDQPVLPVASSSITGTAEGTISTPTVSEELKVASQL
ncbi:hypothetical protein SLEP1_g55275 [Rubroshorea leprosula]|uniref:Uncharacterized protein n=1 Tax=Rubroshorea leprosula TaxID=152421 RepID=A0AAV5MJ23_9ROSI|nr:hypothetical protein SLEP1_g55275 [Rubroshorea leprosula]